MSDSEKVLDSVYSLNQKVLESIVARRYVDADYFAQEIKVMIDKYYSKMDADEGAISEDVAISDESDKKQETLSAEVKKQSNFISSSREKQAKTYENITVLVVDDNELNLEIEEALLKKEGFRVILADSARRAINIFSNSLQGDIQVILTDIAMPGMDGNEMTKEIRGLDHIDAKTVKIIGVSVDRTEQGVKTSFMSGMNGYIKKPFDVKQFKRTIM